MFSNKPPGAFLGRAGLYDYSPTAIQIGNLQQFWWCGEAHNPVLPSQATDTIMYASVDVSTKATSVPIVVLAETPGAWDSAFTCNPKVIGGSFNNPLGDGQTYSYALYYVATSSPAGLANSIGVAFSNDGIHWKKYPQPVIQTTTQQFYGVGQPAVYNSDGKSGIWIFYEDLEGSSNGHYETKSTDGIHFTLQGEVTTNGLQQDLLDVTWGDMAYDSVAGNWYAAFNMPRRSASTTGNVVELGQLGIALYRIPGDSILTGATPWQRLATFDTNLTGHESNFLAGFLRDKYGNVNVGSYPTIQLYTSMSNPSPSWNDSPTAAAKSGDPSKWDIGTVQWVPANQTMALNNYKNTTAQEATTGWIEPGAGFTLQSVLGHLYVGPQQGATIAIYGCKSGATDYFLSTDSGCAGSRLLGVNGFAFPNTVPGVGLAPLYGCRSSHNHFVSHAANCEGSGSGDLLGYALP
ncbi:MAG: hypothetical protein ABSF53_12745 [Terracidiphilus sp.]